MSQVGHADSKMTMDIYAQLQQRAHGRAFDALGRQPRGRLYGAGETSVGRSGVRTPADTATNGASSDAGARPYGALGDVRTGCNEAGFGLDEGEHEGRVVREVDDGET